MSNLFSNYFGGGGSGSETSRFVGQVVDLGEGHKLKIKKVIAEGDTINCRTEHVHVHCAVWDNII